LKKEKKTKRKTEKILFISKNKKKIQNYEIKDILEELNIHSESHFVTNLSILVEWIYDNDVFEVIDPINMNDDEFRRKIFEFVVEEVNGNNPIELDGNPIEIVNINDDTGNFLREMDSLVEQKDQPSQKIEKSSDLNKVKKIHKIMKLKIY
jgi:hypothetical protein